MESERFRCLSRLNDSRRVVHLRIMICVGVRRSLNGGLLGSPCGVVALGNLTPNALIGQIKMAAPNHRQEAVWGPRYMI